MKLAHAASGGPGKTGRSNIIRDYVARFLQRHPGALLFVVDLKVSQSGQYTAAMAGRARWARHSNGLKPAAGWSQGERLIVALILGDLAYIEAELAPLTGPEAHEHVLGRIGGDLAFYGDVTTDPAEWVDQIRGVLHLPQEEYTAATRAWNFLTEPPCSPAG